MKKLLYSIVSIIFLVPVQSSASYMPKCILSLFSKKSSEQHQTVDEKNFLQKCETQLDYLQKIEMMSSSAQKESTLEKLHGVCVSKIANQQLFIEKINNKIYDPEQDGFPKSCLTSDDGLLIQKDIIGYQEAQDIQVLEKLKTASLAQIPRDIACLVYPRSLYSYCCGSLGAFVAYGFLSSDSKNNTNVIAAALLLGASSGIIFHKVFGRKKDYEMAINTHKTSLESSNGLLLQYINLRKGFDQTGERLNSLEAGQIQIQSHMSQNGQSLIEVRDEVRRSARNLDARIQGLEVGVSDGFTSLHNRMGKVQEAQGRLEERFDEFKQQLSCMEIKFDISLQNFKEWMLQDQRDFEKIKNELREQYDENKALQMFTILQNMKTQEMVAALSQGKNLSLPSSRSEGDFQQYFSSKKSSVPQNIPFYRPYQFSAGGHLKTRVITYSFLIEDSLKQDHSSSTRPQTLQITHGSEAKK